MKPRYVRAVLVADGNGAADVKYQYSHRPDGPWQEENAMSTKSKGKFAARAAAAVVVSLLVGVAVAMVLVSLFGCASKPAAHLERWQWFLAPDCAQPVREAEGWLVRWCAA